MWKLSEFAKLSITCLSIVVILACGGGDGGGSSSAFTTGDLAGDSKIFGVSVGGTNPGILGGGVTVDSGGNITDGQYAHSSTPGTINVTGGLLSLDSDGFLSGSINTDIGATSTIQFGKLNKSKSFASFVSSTNYGEYDLVTVIKSGGAFSQADFQGSWHICELSSGGTVKDVYSNAYDINSAGLFDGDNVMGTISINNTGDFTGSGSLLLGGRVDMEGVMDRSKELAVYISRYTTGRLSMSVAIKIGYPFVTTDLSGTWHFTLANAGGIREGISYGTIQLDSAGQIIGGYYRSTNGDIPWTGGELRINSFGNTFGEMNAADGEIFIIGNGQMNNSRNTMWLEHRGGGDLIIAHKL